MAILTFKASTVISWDQGLYFAFSYLKKGDRKKFNKLFDQWIFDNLEKSFDQHKHEKYMQALFSAEESQFINDIWEKHHNKYSNMDKYKLYCELYKQHYVRPEFNDDDFDDDDFEIPQKLSKKQFEILKSEYFHFDSKTMFGDADDADYDKLFELRDLLFSDTLWG